MKYGSDAAARSESRCRLRTSSTFLLDAPSEPLTIAPFQLLRHQSETGTHLLRLQQPHSLVPFANQDCNLPFFDRPASKSIANPRRYYKSFHFSIKGLVCYFTVEWTVLYSGTLNPSHVRRRVNWWKELELGDITVSEKFTNEATNFRGHCSED